MDFFNYFIKQIIRIFTRRFFWVIMILILVFLGWTCFANSSNAIDSFVYGSNMDHRLQNNTYYSVQNANRSIINYAIIKRIISDTAYEYSLLLFNNNGYFNYNRNTNEVYIGHCLFYGLYNPDWENEFPYRNTWFESTSDVRLHYDCWNNNPNFAMWGMVDYEIIYSSFTSGDLSSSHNMSIYDFAAQPNIDYENPNILNFYDIPSWNFNTLNIFIGPLPYDSTYSYALDYELNGAYYSTEVGSFYNPSTRSFNVPRSMLSNNVVIRDGDNIHFYFEFRSPTEVLYYDFDDYTLSITSAEQQVINEDSEKQVQGEILDETKKTNEKIEELNDTQKETNEKIDEINNTITDTNIPDNIDNDLPQDNTQDITQNGVNGIFTSIYNAFCNGEAQDIVFPIPFTDKSITIDPDYISDALASINASFITTIIQAFWWYLISRFIVKDVMNKINKIKSGNIEEIETSNIKGDML